MFAAGARSLQACLFTDVRFCVCLLNIRFAYVNQCSLVCVCRMFTCFFSWAVYILVSRETPPHIFRGELSCESVSANGSRLLGTFSPSFGCQVDVYLHTESDLSRFESVFGQHCTTARIDSWKFAVRTDHDDSVLLFNPSGFGRLVSENFHTDFPSMQFTGMLANRQCVYLGIYDYEASPKEIGGQGSEVYATYRGTVATVQVKQFDDGCSWETFANLYRENFAQFTVWAKRGIKRPLALHTKLPIWINTHWQENDVLETGGGDPFVVLKRVERFLNLLDMCVDEDLVLLHWYEWDMLGYKPDGSCDSNVCGFDSHYPEYFPAVEGFGQVVEKLKKLGVVVVPYINGRIHEVSLLRDEAMHATCRHQNGTMFTEEYGNGVEFAVMCPFTEFWQNLLNEIGNEIVANWPLLGGIYIDQIAAATPVECWDESHEHAPGGAWTHGNMKILDGMPQNGLLMTESNVEQFIGFVDVFLTLPAYSGNLSEIVPAFQYIYRNAVHTGGAEFFESDVISQTGFVEKLMKQLLFGSQLGWWSIGKSSQTPSMEVLDQLEKNQLLVHTLQNIVKQRVAITDFLTQGHLTNCENQWTCNWLLDDESISIACNPTTQRIKTQTDSTVLILNVQTNTWTFIDEHELSVIDSFKCKITKWVNSVVTLETM